MQTLFIEILNSFVGYKQNFTSAVCDPEGFTITLKNGLKVKGCRDYILTAPSPRCYQVNPNPYACLTLDVGGQERALYQQIGDFSHCALMSEIARVAALIADITGEK